MQAHKELCCSQGEGEHQEGCTPLLLGHEAELGWALSAGARAAQAPEVPLWAIFGVCVLDKSVTDSRIFWPLRGTSEKHEPVCIYYCLHLFNILENLSY